MSRSVKHFRIHLPACAGRGGWVECDGERLDNVRAVRVAGSVDEITTVMSEYVNVTVDIEADAPEYKPCTCGWDATPDQPSPDCEFPHEGAA